MSARAAEIEKACRIRVGHEELCSPEISDDLTFVQLLNGMVLPRRVAADLLLFVIVYRTATAYIIIAGHHCHRSFRISVTHYNEKPVAVK